MLRFRASSVLVPLAVLALAIPAAAQPPEIGAGECLYLVGAPPGAPAAETEETFEESRIYDGCRHPAQVDLNRDGPNSVQAWIEEDPFVTGQESYCRAMGLVGHSFMTAEDLPADTQAWVSVGASLGVRLSLDGATGFTPSSVDLKLRIEEVGSGGRIRLAEVTLWRLQANHRGDVTESEEGGLRVPFPARPGRQYRIALVMEAAGVGGITLLDAGRPGTELGAHYGFIEVCIESPAGGAAGADDIERDLYERRCYPRLWLPEALGGRYGEARSLVATRLSQAVASGSPGVNDVLAERRLEEADAYSAEDQQQKACRALVHALHALTTP